MAIKNFAVSVNTPTTNTKTTATPDNLSVVVLVKVNKQPAVAYTIEGFVAENGRLLIYVKDRDRNIIHLTQVLENTFTQVRNGE